jgi:PAT family acetyl-CoA transporter-like MFS transporter 1
MAKRRSAKQEVANGLMQNGVGKKKVNGTSVAKSEEHKVRGDSGKSAKLNGDSPHAETKEVEAKTAAHGDGAAITLLMFLYLLQGIPLGLAGCLPYLLQDRKVSYTDQAVLSLIFWPYSVKLLWAPLVDCLYVSRFGRRKSWLVPTQYLIGLFMVGLSTRINALMGDEEDPLGQGQGQGSINVTLLAALFFALNFLAATQDVAVDGWALTMLSR